ncbi:MAG: thioesterase domain-containing protein/acyl carrier protein, partial [Candidatus Paceibacteria bacterium]
AEGAVAFRRALASNQSKVIISSLDLTGLVKQSDIVTTDKAAGQKFQRPELDTDYTAPSNDIERNLAGFWQELLGVEKVGIDDNFFDLGGHSLIAVRLFAMVKKAYRVDFPISVLFEAPTIGRCASLIAEKTGIDLDAEPQSSEVAETATTPKRRFSHLVAMHEGDAAAKTPFFLVAGMFGNVLNLRHLAQLVGKDRPFYGLQARGLFGEQTPHETLVEAAADYIAEMRIIQPHGPYLMGGFSGGGITAFEMAHQLEAAGEQVDLLAMLDSPLPVRRPLLLKDRALIQLHEIKSKGPKYLAQWVFNRLRWELSKRRGDVKKQAVPYAPGFNNTVIETAFLKAVDMYELRSWTGNLALLRPPQIGKWQVGGGRSVNSERAYLLPDNDWGNWVDDMQVIEVPGDHDSMVLEPNVRVLATSLRGLIEATETKPNATQKNEVNWPFDQAAE